MPAFAEAVQMPQQRVDETFNELMSREFVERHSQNLGRQALIGADVILASDVPEIIGQAEQRNLAIIHAVTHRTSESMSTSSNSGTTLNERFELSAHGDKEARAAIDVDALTEVTEQMCKAGAVLKVQAKVTRDGEIEQFGQTTQMRQKNTLATYSLKSSALRETIYAEGQNGFFIEEAHKQGLLAGKRVVEFSLIPDAAHQALAKHGYYLREVIGILRVTTIDKQGNCEIVSVLVGGTDQDRLPPIDKIKTEQAEIAAEKQALSNRFDIIVVRDIYSKLTQKDAHRLSTDQMLSEPMIIDDKHDYLDITMLFDQIASQVAGKTLFFGLPYKGEGQPSKADYKAHEAKSLDFQSKLKTVSKKVADEAINRRHEATTNLETAKLFREIAKNHAVQHLIKDRTADIRVFGAPSYHLMTEARKHYDMGNYTRAQSLTVQAQEKAKATGCPGDEKSGKGLKNMLKSLVSKIIDKLMGKETDDEEESEIPDNIRCIKCRETSPKEDVVNEDTWRCPCCHYEIDVCTGEVKHPSDVDAA